MDNRKRLILIVVLILTAILIGIGLYLMFRAGKMSLLRPKPPATITTTTLPIAGEKPSTTTIADETGKFTTLPTSELSGTVSPSYYRPQAVTQISTDYAVYDSLNNNGTLRYYNALDGKFYKIATDGSIKEIIDETFYNVQNVTWAKTKDTAVIEYPDSTKVIYNFEKNSKVTIPKYWEDFSFSPTGDEVAAKSIGLSPENRYLITTKDDGTGTKIIEPMGNHADDVTVSWSPSKQTVALSQTGAPQGADRREVLLVGLNGENFKSLIVEGANFESQWSDTGQNLLYSVNSARSDYKPELWIAGAYGNDIGSNRQLLNLATWADKCTFSGDTTLYCAVPRTLPTGAGMNKKIADSTYDDMYKVDVTTGLKTPINLGNDNYTVNNISYDTKNNKIFFTDINKIGVFEIKL